MDNSIALNTALRSIEQCDALLFPIVRSLGAVGLDKLANEIRFIAEGIDDDVQVAKRAAEAISVERLQYSQKMVGGVLKLASDAVKDEGRGLAIIHELGRHGIVLSRFQDNKRMSDAECAAIIDGVK